MGKNGLIRRHDHQLGILVRVVDALIIIATLYLAKQLYKVGWSPNWSMTALLGVAIFYISANINHLYQSYRLGGMSEETPRLLMTWLMTVGGLLLVGYMLKSTHTLSRVVLGLWLVFTPLFLLLFRFLVRSVLSTLRRQGHNTRSVVIVGVNENAKRLATEVLSSPWLGLNLLGFASRTVSGAVLVPQEKGRTMQVPVVGDLEALYAKARKGEIDVVYVATPTSDRETIDSILHELGDSTVSIFLVPDFYTASVMQGHWVSLGSVPTVSVIDNPTQGMDALAKRIEDLLLATTVILVMGIPMLLIALGVKLSSPGPVIYRQRRYGLNGKAFNMLKFRSMRVVEQDDEFVQARKDDARITPFGAFLRKSSLDELPQFFNVMLGEMSVVGPRPHAAAHNEEFRSRINGYMLRHKAKPGITGLAQIKGFRGETDTDEKMRERVRFDVEYINNWSIWMDLMIVFATPWSVIRGKNAY